MIYLITYDLKKPGQDYESIYNIIKSANKWWHYLESTWLIKTNDSVDSWNDKLKVAIDKNDRLLIVNITKQKRQGWLPTEAWDWIRENEIDSH